MIHIYIRNKDKCAEEFFELKEDEKLKLTVDKYNKKTLMINGQVNYKDCDEILVEVI